MGMIFFYAGREYAGGTAAEIVRAMVSEAEQALERTSALRVTD